DNQTELITHFSKLEVSHLTLQLKYQDLKDQIGSNPTTPDKDIPDFDSVFVIGKMQASLQGKDNVIRQLKKKLSQLQVTHQDTDRTLRVQTTDSKITKLTDQELLEYAIGTCPHGSQPRAKQLDHTPLIRKKQVSVAQPFDKGDSTIHPHVVTVKSQKINAPVPPSTGVDCCPIACGSQPMSHVKPNRILPSKGDTKLPIDDKPRKTSTRIDSSSRLKRTVINLHSDFVCQTCAKCVTPSNHDLCVATCLQSAMATPSIHHNRSVERKLKQVWKPKHVRQVWKPIGKVLTTIGHQLRPTGQIFDLGNQCPLTKFTPPKVVSSTQHTRQTNLCANQKEPYQNWGSNLSNSPSLSGFKCRMAVVNDPSDQTPTMAPPVRTDDQILPHIRAFTASSDLPSIYIQQFWDTILYDKKAGCYKCQLDEQWFDLTKETLMEALQITPVNRNQSFATPPSINGLVDFVNQLGYPKLVINLSTIVTNDLFQPWRALLTIINLCLTGKTYDLKDQGPLCCRFYGALSHELILITPRGSGRNLPNPYILSLMKTESRKHRFHPRPDSPLHLSNEEPVLGYLKFSAKGTKREIFRMPIPGRLITANIQAAPYYQEYQENVSKHRGFLAGEIRSTQDLPAPRPAKPARKPQIKRSVSRNTRQSRGSPKSVGASEAEEVPAEEPQVAEEDADFQKAMEESMKDAYALPKGPLPPVVIREPESGKYQPLSEVPGKGNAKVSEEHVAHDLLSLQKHKKTSPADQYIFQRRVSEPTASSFLDVSPYEVLGQLDSKEESKKIVLGVEKSSQEEGQAGSNPDESSEGQAGPDPGNAEARVQSTSSPMVHAGSDREHIDTDVANVSLQPSTEQLYKVFTTIIYPNVQENLKLAVEEPVLLEEPASSSGTLSSLQHEHPKLKATTTDTTTTTTTTFPPLQAPQQSTTEAMMVKRIVSEVVTDAVDWAIQAPLCNRFRDLPEADMKEILHQCMWETDSYKSNEVHMQLFEALEKSINRDQSEELAHDLAKARKKKKKSRESPKMPPGSPSHQPPPPPPPAGPSKTSGAPRTSESQVTPPPPPPPTSTNQDSPSTGSAAPSPIKTVATTKHQAWLTPDVTLKPLVSLTPEDLDLDEAMGPDEQAQLSDEEDIESAHIPTVNLRQGWWKPFEEERHATPEPAWSIRSFDVPVPPNNWASTLASNYSPPPEDSLLA
nr:hypothetical protein [Tanacetum cinerariifolium]